MEAQGGIEWYLSHKRQNYIYIGYTEDLRQRIKDHNKGFSKSTKPYLPLEIIHYEAYRNEKDAKRREKYLKTNKGKMTMMTMLKEYFS